MLNDSIVNKVPFVAIAAAWNFKFSVAKVIQE